MKLNPAEFFDKRRERLLNDPVFRVFYEQWRLGVAFEVILEKMVDTLLDDRKLLLERAIDAEARAYSKPLQLGAVEQGRADR